MRFAKQKEFIHKAAKYGGIRTKSIFIALHEMHVRKWSP
jgi:hypothetical protein